MACWRIAILVAILLFSLGVQGGDYFHCHRKGQDCANSKTCNDDGSCDCGSDYIGYGCGLATSKKGQSPCSSETDSCGADGGLCYSTGAAKDCYCPADSYGDQCENKRYTVECTASAMKIMLSPAGTFSGVIYVAGEKNTSGCMFTGSSGTLDLQDESCGDVTTDTATGDRSRVVIVQYSDKYITDLDTKLTVTCSAAGAGTVDVTATFSSQDPDGNIKEQAINNTYPADIDSSAVNFEIKLKDGTSVSSSTTVSLNDQLIFEFADKLRLRVESCTASNGKSGADEETLKLIENRLVITLVS
ncbi:EGF-like domain-containing protein 1 [Gigantopelta aegis]|uniref:EGF-like domain-containing protein 1 n=1 Tax=Gigantopelta aegis TaxID=1735272 RepID=UPI001B887695|nr:EGF-like domain-containing protein 1 [Gigantopelta aegis]